MIDPKFRRYASRTLLSYLDNRGRLPIYPPIRTFRNSINNVEVSPPNINPSSESDVAVDPNDPNHLIAGAVTTSSNAGRNYAYVSRDGGKTWAAFIAFPDAEEGASIAIGDDVAYFASLLPTQTPPLPNFGLAVSVDGGQSWSVTDLHVQCDKTAVAARGKLALAAATNFTNLLLFVRVAGDKPGDWHPVAIPEIGQGCAPAISPNGKFYLAWCDYNNMLIKFAYSLDGLSWSQAIAVAGNVALFYNLPGGFNDGDASTLSMTGTNMVVDDAGKIYLFFNQNNRPMLTISEDEGKSWSNPVDIDPGDSNPHAMPAICSPALGQVSAYNLQWDGQFYSIIRHFSADGGQTWTHETITDKPFFAAPPAPGFRIGFGDYMGCDAKGGVEAAAWSESPVDAWQTFANVLGSGQGPPPPPDHFQAGHAEGTFRTLPTGSQKIPVEIPVSTIVTTQTTAIIPAQLLRDDTKPPSPIPNYTITFSVAGQTLKMSTDGAGKASALIQGLSPDTIYAYAIDTPES